MSQHSERAHSIFSASGSERWLNCSASVKLSEKAPPEVESPWAIEGTEAHEVLETLFRIRGQRNFKRYWRPLEKDSDPMIANGILMVNAVYELKETLFDADLLVEVRVQNKEIHEDMFGTVDAALVEIFGTLHVLDYKYGKGHVVDPERNTQMIQYALGLAEKYEWNFTNVVVHIMQPRAGKTWHKQWEMSIDELKNYKTLWQKGVARVLKGGTKPFPGNWCHWCKAKTICPALREKGVQKIQQAFEDNPLPQTKGSKNGKQEKSAKAKSKKGQGKEKGFKKNPFA